MTTSAPARTIAIGDVHGCSAALRAVLEAIGPTPDDLIVTLGDYVDRGPDSRGVFDCLIELADRCQLVSILGNHDDMLLQAIDGHHTATLLAFGGAATLASYGGSGPEDLCLIPVEHVRFLRGCVDYFETDTHIFVHGSYVPNLAMSDQPELALRWESLRDDVPAPAFFRQDRHRRPHIAAQRRDPRPGTHQVHRHALLWRGLADRPGSAYRARLAGEPRRAITPVELPSDSTQPAKFH